MDFYFFMLIIVLGTVVLGVGKYIRANFLFMLVAAILYLFGGFMLLQDGFSYPAPALPDNYTDQYNYSVQMKTANSTVCLPTGYWNTTDCVYINGTMVPSYTYETAVSITYERVLENHTTVYYVNSSSVHGQETTSNIFTQAFGLMFILISLPLLYGAISPLR